MVTVHRKVTAAPPPARTVHGLTLEDTVRRYAPRVERIARGIWSQLFTDGSVDLDDLVSLGTIGLLGAFDRYDPERGIDFAMFAGHRIRGAIYDGLRQGDVLTRRRRQVAKQVEHATAGLERTLGRLPSMGETAEVLGVTIDKVSEALDKPTRVWSPLGESASFLEAVAGADQLRPSDRIVADELRRALEEVILELSERHRRVLQLYYDDQVQQREIGLLLGVTGSRVSLLLTEARAVLAKKLRARGFEAADAALGHDP